jgi:hypothetical protein
MMNKPAIEILGFFHSIAEAHPTVGRRGLTNVEKWRSL